MNMNYSAFEKILKSNGYKLTTQRKKVLEVLQEKESQHLTADEIYKHVKKKCPEIGLATVYRTLQLLSDLGITETLNLDDGFVRYEIGELNDKHHHHHLICEKCNTVIGIEDDMLDNIEDRFMNDYGFKVTNHVVKFYGVCSNCQKKTKEEHF